MLLYLVNNEPKTLLNLSIFRMLDFFSILSKGGLVLWYFQADLLKLDFQAAVNEMIKYALIDV